MAWKARKSFQVATGSLATRAEIPVTALGCQMMNSVCACRPAAAR